MADEVLEAATSERCVRDDWRPDLRAQLTAPGQLPAGFGNKAPPAINLPSWEWFDTLLQEADEHRRR